MDATEGLVEENSQVAAKASLPVVEASITVPALNDLVVTLIKPLRNARVRVIRHLTNKLRKLRASKKPSEFVEKKANNMLEEIKEIKAMKLNNDVVKKLLAKEVNEKDLSKAASPAERALMRLALQKSQFTDLVSKFRQEHADWVSLTEFMLSKHGGRRFRKKNAKVSSEKLAKATLDVADKRAREQYASNDQRHQHNKRPVAMKPSDDRRILEGSEIKLTEVDAGQEKETVNRQSSDETATKGPSTWLSSIFSVPKENESAPVEEIQPKSAEGESVPKEHKRKEIGEGVVVKLDPEMLNKPSSEGATLSLPFDGIARKRKSAPEPVIQKADAPSVSVEEAPGESIDFFMPLDEGANDEISRAGGNVLTFNDFADESEETGGRYARGNRGRGTGYGRGRGSRGFTHSRQLEQQRPPRSSNSNFQSRGRGDSRHGNSAPPKVEEKLHGSWEARRQQRNEQKIQIGKAVPKQHLKFADDD